MKTCVCHRNLRGVFSEPRSARTLGVTEKTPDKFMPSEDVNPLHCLKPDGLIMKETYNFMDAPFSF
jgi:hypothetical protein